MNEISESTLPEFGQMVLLVLFTGEVIFAAREKSERLPSQWFWAAPTGWYPADVPTIVGWMPDDPSIITTRSRGREFLEEIPGLTQNGKAQP